VAADHHRSRAVQQHRAGHDHQERRVPEFADAEEGLLWIVFAAIVIYYTSHQVWLSYDNFAIVQGTDDVMQWWFYMATPLAFSLLIVRTLQNLWRDLGDFRAGRPFNLQVSIFGD
jgi:TRAP-type mannitol/chloroaromatic compound transport system permease small subunit